MRTSFCCALLVATGLLAAAAPAAAADYDGFDYTTTALNGQSGGSGWNGPWAASTGSSVTLSNDGTSLSYPAQFQFPTPPPPTSGSRVLTTGAANSVRLISDVTDMSQEGNVLYASALIQKNTAPGTATDSILFEFFDAPGNRRFGFGMEAADAFWINANSSNSTGTATPGQTYFLVARLVTGAGTTPDVASLKIFGPGHALEVPTAEPTSWDVSTQTSSNAVLDRVRLRIDANNVNAQVDELRIGRTWQSVIPEPSSLAVLGLAGVALACRRRRS